MTALDDELVGRLLLVAGLLALRVAPGAETVLATTAVGQIRQWLDTPALMVADIFAARTVGALAVLLRGHEVRDGRLDTVAEVYLEVAGMDRAEVISALGAS